MYYRDVLVGDATFHGNEALTYASDEPLAVGALVMVPLRHKQVLGMVAGNHPKPSFAVKPVSSIAALPPLPGILHSLFTWMKDYYPAPLGIHTQLLLPKQLPKKPLPVQSLPALPLVDLPALSNDQVQALTAIASPGLHLLHGETGTGKTRVYIELAKRALQRGRSSLILTPEIGLTSQLAHGFRTVFGKERVVVIHSQLSSATRERLWQYLLEQPEPVIVIGARSALFSPLRDIGLIVVDESHETAYKQDQAPYYHATPVAAKLATLHQATLVLGSATPLITDYYIAQAKHRPIIRMLQPAKSSNFSERSIKIIDLRDRGAFTKSSYLSTELVQDITTTLAKREQALIFLNRRGTARVVFCDTCGWHSVCPHCDLPLVYHGDFHIMRCHSCDYKAVCPNSCPICRNTSIVFKNIGTKAVVSDLERLFSGARIMRFDTDNKKNERIEQHYTAVRNGEVDILVGTQTLAKGLDLPRLSLVGVVIADTGLSFPDFSAQERTYQLLSQVVGRVGRGHRQGHVVIQTYSPGSPLLSAIIDRNWDDFYKNENVERRTFNFPPFCYLLKLGCRRATPQSAQTAAEKLAQQIRSGKQGAILEGPAPAFHEKVQNKFGWQLIVKARRRSVLTDIIHELPSGWSYDIDPMNLL